MHRSRRLLAPLALSTAAACAVGLVAAGAASADDDDGGKALLRSGLVGSTPSPAGPTLFGSTPGGAPWLVDHNSSVRVRDDGRVDIKIRGLILTATGQNSPNITTVTASIVCNGAPVTSSAMTDPAPIGLAGDARIRDRVELPEPCLAPAVLIHPNGAAARYIAANGG